MSGTASRVLVNSPARRVFIVRGMAGFGLWLISGKLPAAPVGPRIPLQKLDVPLWRSLAFSVHHGGSSVQLSAGTVDRGPLVYGVDALGARALARIPLADKKTIGVQVTGTAVFTHLVKSGNLYDSNADRLLFREYLTMAVQLGILVPDSYTQKVETRIEGNIP